MRFVVDLFLEDLVTNLMGYSGFYSYNSGNGWFVSCGC
jgi:hypothetical protein